MHRWEECGLQVGLTHQGHWGGVVSFGDVVQPEHSVGALGISGSFHGGESPGKGTPAAAGAMSPAQDILQPVFQLSSVMASEAEQCVARSNREMY